MAKVTSKNLDGTLRIYIDGILHLRIYNGVLLENTDLQSWIDDTRSPRMYCIELYHRKKAILLEYDDKELWEKILKILDKYDPCGS